LRRQRGDRLDDSNRWWIIAAAPSARCLTPSCFSCSKILSKRAFLSRSPRFYSLEKPSSAPSSLLNFPNVSSASLRALAISSLFHEDHTVGVATSLPWGINFADGLRRHPTQLYEIIFLLLLAGAIFQISRHPHCQGDLFKIFMIPILPFASPAISSNPTHSSAAVVLDLRRRPNRQ
jgi:hypothetical protein